MKRVLKIVLLAVSLGLLIWAGFLPGYGAIVIFLIGASSLLYNFYFLSWGPKRRKVINKDLEHVDYIP